MKDMLSTFRRQGTCLIKQFFFLILRFRARDPLFLLYVLRFKFLTGLFVLPSHLSDE